jgi:hypothetical protein
LEEKTFIAVNKDNMISPEDFDTYVPKKRQKNNTIVVENTNPGVIVNKPDHLSAFTVDRDKIEFFKQAVVLKDKIQKSEKLREAALKNQTREIAKKVVEK